MQYRRIKKNKEFQKIFQKGKRGYASSLTLLYEPAKELSMGICIGKKHGKSVQRNRIKRLLRAAFLPEAKKLKSVNILLLPKVKEEYSLKTFQKDLSYLLSKENLYQK